MKNDLQVVLNLIREDEAENRAAEVEIMASPNGTNYYIRWAGERYSESEQTIKQTHDIEVLDAWKVGNNWIQY